MREHKCLCSSCAHVYVSISACVAAVLMCVQCVCVWVCSSLGVCNFKRLVSMHVFKHKLTHTHAHTHAHKRVLALMQKQTHTHAHTHVLMLMQKHARTHTHTCSRSCRNTHTRTHTYTYAHTHTHTTHTHTHARTAQGARLSRLRLTVQLLHCCKPSRRKIALGGWSSILLRYAFYFG